MPPTAIIPYPAGFVAGLSQPVYIDKRTTSTLSLDAWRRSAGCVALLLEPCRVAKFPARVRLQKSENRRLLPGGVNVSKF